MLEVRELTKRYNGIAVVDHVSLIFSIRERYWAISVRTAPARAPPSRCSSDLLILLEDAFVSTGTDVGEDLKAFQHRLGYVPEEASLYPHLSGREYLQLVGGLRGLRREALEAKMNELLRFRGRAVADRGIGACARSTISQGSIRPASTRSMG